MRVTGTEARNRFGSLCSQAKREPVFVEKAGHYDRVFLSAEQHQTLQAGQITFPSTNPWHQSGK